MRLATKLNFLRALIVSLQAALFACPVVAAEKLAEDVSVESDSLSFSQDSGVVVYEGNAVVRSGKFSLFGDRIEMLAEDGVMKKIVSNVGISKLQVDIDNGDPIIARAQLIEINLAESVIHLRGNASAEYQNYVLSGGHFLYKLKDNTLETMKGSGRARVMLKSLAIDLPQKSLDKRAQETSKPPVANKKKEVKPVRKLTRVPVAKVRKNEQAGDK